LETTPVCRTNRCDVLNGAEEEIRSDAKRRVRKSRGEQDTWRTVVSTIANWIRLLRMVIAIFHPASLATRDSPVPLSRKSRFWQPRPEVGHPFSLTSTHHRTKLAALGDVVSDL